MRLSPDEISEAIGWRRYLHERPELSLKEYETSTFIAKLLTGWGIPFRSGYGGTGIVGTIAKGISPRVIAIRADIDALPIEEATALPYASRNPGKMHACGHDGHTAILLATAKRARHIDFDGTVHFIFQSAEESDGGARRMIEDGLFRDFDCDAVYALHNWPSLPVGQCVARDGAMMAAFAIFDIEVTGRGAHAAMPHEGIDPILATSEMVSALQSIASRSISPLDSGVVTVTQFHAGDTWNVTPERAIIRGTARWFAAAVGDKIEERLKRIVDGIAAAHGCSASIDFQRRYPATVNNAVEAGRVRELLGDGDLGMAVVDSPPSMASEDFSFMLQHKPGCYVWLGAARDGENPGLHSPRYDFNDEILPQGAALWLNLIGCRLLP